MLALIGIVATVWLAVTGQPRPLHPPPLLRVHGHHGGHRRGARGRRLRLHPARRRARRARAARRDARRPRDATAPRAPSEHDHEHGTEHAPPAPPRHAPCRDRRGDHRGSGRRAARAPAGHAHLGHRDAAQHQQCGLDARQDAPALVGGDTSQFTREGLGAAPPPEPRRRLLRRQVGRRRRIRDSRRPTIPRTSSTWPASS